MSYSRLLSLFLIALSLVHGFSHFSNHVNVVHVHCTLQRDGVLYASNAGVPNSVALSVDNHVVLCLWGEVTVALNSHKAVMAPVYSDSIEVERRGERVVLTSDWVAYYGSVYEEGKSYVEWRSKRLTMNGAGIKLVWRGSGTVLESYNDSTLIALIGSIHVNTTANITRQVRSILALTPLATIVDLHGTTEIYGIGMLYPRLDLGKVYSTKDIVSLAKRNLVVFSIVILYNRDTKTSITFSGASMEIIKVDGREYLKLSLGIVRRGSGTSSPNIEADSYTLVLVSKRSPNTIAKLALDAVKHSTNPVIALQLIWRALSIGFSTTKTITITVVSTKIVEKRLSPFEASAITLISLITGIAIGIVLMRYVARSRSTS